MLICLCLLWIKPFDVPTLVDSDSTLCVRKFHDTIHQRLGLGWLAVVDGELCQAEVEIMGKDMEPMNRFTIDIVNQIAGRAVDGGDRFPGGIRQRPQPEGEGIAILLLEVQLIAVNSGAPCIRSGSTKGDILLSERSPFPRQCARSETPRLTFVRRGVSWLRDPGDDRLSRLSTIIGLAGLTAVFGMGTGVAPPVWSPGNGP